MLALPGLIYPTPAHSITAIQEAKISAESTSPFQENSVTAVLVLPTSTPTPSPTPKIPTLPPRPATKAPQAVQSTTPAPKASPSPNKSLVSTPKPTKPEVKVVDSDPKPIKLTPEQELLKAAGIAESDWVAADYVIMREGSYRPCVINGGTIDCTYAINGGRKAYGVCQSLPGKKMATAGEDWATNPVTQLKWCDQYAKARYGGWQQAKAAWIRQHWW